MKWGGEQQEIGERWRVMSCMYQAKESRPFFLYNRRWRNFKASKREITRFVFYKENWQCENGTGGGQDRIWEISFKEVFIQWRRPQSLGRQLVRHSEFTLPCAPRCQARVFWSRFPHCTGLDRWKPHRRGLLLESHRVHHPLWVTTYLIFSKLTLKKVK